MLCVNVLLLVVYGLGCLVRAGTYDDYVTQLDEHKITVRVGAEDAASLQTFLKADLRKNGSWGRALTEHWGPLRKVGTGKYMLLNGGNPDTP